MSLAIVDLGYGNLGSIARAFQRLGVEATRTADPDVLRAARRVVLPGVGAAGYAMGRIAELGLTEVLRELTQPVLGICLGMQLLFEMSEEQDTACLGLIGGGVRRLRPSPGVTVPHMGWSRLSVAKETPGLADGDYVYFAHSFACEDGTWTLATASHGGPVPAVVRQGNVMGAQFHPERSGPAGTRFLRGFLAL